MEYSFMNRPYSEADALVRAMAADWDEGRKALFSGSVRNWAQQSAREIYYLALAAENNRKKTPEREDVIYFRWLYKSARLSELYWKGVSYGDPSQVAALLEARSVPALEGIIARLAASGLFSLFLSSAGAGDDICRQAEVVERLLRRKGSQIPIKSIPVLMKGVLLGKNDFTFDGISFTTLAGLAEELQKYADQKPELLEAETTQLYTEDGCMQPEFLIWLLKQGQEKAVLSWHSRFQPAGEETSQTPEDDFSDDFGGSIPATPEIGHIPTLKKPEFFVI